MNTSHLRSLSNQSTQLAAQQMLEWSFEEAVKQFAIKNSMAAAAAASGAPSVTQPYQVRRGDPSPVSDTAGKVLWQSLAQKRSPSFTKPAGSDAEKSISEESKVGKDGSESGDGSSNTLVTARQTTAVAQALETGAGDAAKSTARDVTAAMEVPVGGWAGWQAVDRAASPAEDKPPDVEESFRTSLDCSGGGGGLVDASDVSGEESFYSVTSNAPVPPSAAANDDDDDDDVTEDSNADTDDDAATVNQAPADTGMNVSVGHQHYQASKDFVFDEKMMK